MSLQVLNTPSGALPVFPVAAIDAEGNPVTAYLTANAITDLAGNELFGNLTNPVAGSVLALLAHMVALQQQTLTVLQGGAIDPANPVQSAAPGTLDFSQPGNPLAL